MSANTLAALSPSGHLVAFLVSSSDDISVVRVAVRKTSAPATSHLNLRYEIERDDTEEQPEAETCQCRKISFVDGERRLLALRGDVLIVWDLARAVVDYTYNKLARLWDVSVVSSPNDEESSRICILGQEIAREPKLQVHSLEGATGTVRLKNRVGKLISGQTYPRDAPVLAVSSRHTLVLHGNGEGRVINTETGKRVAKLRLSDQKGLSSCLVLPAQERAVICVGPQAALLELESGTVLHRWTLSSVDTNSSTKLSCVPGWLLVNRTHLYRLLGDDQGNSNGTALACSIHLDPTLESCYLWPHFADGSDVLLAALCREQHGPWRWQSKVKRPRKEGGRLDIRLSIDEANGEEGESSRKKRQRHSESVLGSVQVGGDSLQVSEGQDYKRAKLASAMEEASQEGMDDETPIGKRLELMRQLADAKDSDDDEEETTKEVAADENDNGSSGKPFAGKVTTESLTRLLEQALHARDDAMLELALGVKHVSVVKATCQTLTDEDLGTLLTGVTHRLIKTPNRGDQMTRVWLQTILSLGRDLSTERLEPLQQLVKERTSVYPDLLRLEGRLSMFTSPDAS